jgi:hypothetical protein
MPIVHASPLLVFLGLAIGIYQIGDAFSLNTWVAGVSPR